MLRPSITDYIDAFENPAGVFRTLGEPAVERDVYGAPQFLAGNSAAIFTCRDGGRRRFLKCYIRPNPHLRAVYDYIERRQPAMLPRVRLLREEIFIHTRGGDAGWVDVVEGEWTEGETLAAAVALAARAGDAVRLWALADAFDVLWASLSAAEWAHGDLKPENIIVRSGTREDGAGWLCLPASRLGHPSKLDGSRLGTGCGFAEKRPKCEYDTHTFQLSGGRMEHGASGSAEPPGAKAESDIATSPTLHSLTLIDCDAMWIPALEGQRAAELGTPEYRHPSRSAAHFDKTIDDYSAHLISVSLRAIALAPELYAKYNTPEVLLLSPSEIALGRSAAFVEVSELFAKRGMERELGQAATLALK